MKKNKKNKSRLAMLLAAVMLLNVVQVPYMVQAEELTKESAGSEEVTIEEYEILPSPHSITYENEYTVYNPLIHYWQVMRYIRKFTKFRQRAAATLTSPMHN